MVKRVLIANRGEIACRIIKTLKRLNIESVAAFSVADKDAMHVQMADDSVCIGPAKAKDSYLNISQIIAAAEISGADAIAPGYGFLSENATFAEIIEECGLTFIGPTSKQIKLLGNKIRAREVAKRAGCPIIPGSDDRLSSVSEGIEIANKIGYPVFIKASAGGGGKGIRKVSSDEGFKKAYAEAKEEAKLSFGDDSLYLEKMIERPKHVEVQIVGDTHGNVVHLYERDCTLQRRRQKLIEETLSPSVSSQLREEICSSAVSLMKTCGYLGLGTVEYLVDEFDRFYFMEVNTRIQVEHTITEVLTGLDLVEVQVNIARGEPLAFSAEDIYPTGHVIEFRINAEDPDLDFRPSPGLLGAVLLPVGEGVRCDTAIYSGARVSPYYDSMIAKVIVKGRDRDEAIEKSKLALKEFKVNGIKTTIPFHLKMLEDPLFVNNEHTILSIDERSKEKERVLK